MNLETAQPVVAAPVSQGWSKLCPFGIFAAADWGPASGLEQVLTPELAGQMVAHFNSIKGKLRNLWRGLPVFVGHPDVDRSVWRDERRLGKVEALEVRNDGLYFRSAWNRFGLDNIQEGFWVYPSPVFRCRKGQGNQILCDRLQSVGLTNVPNIPGVDPVSANCRIFLEHRSNEVMETLRLMESERASKILGALEHSSNL